MNSVTLGVRYTTEFDALHIAVAGAGLVGRMLGWRLRESGHSVTLFEKSSRSEPQSAAYVAAAMLAPMSELPDCAPGIWEQAQASLTQWPTLLEELNVPYGMDGSLVIAHVVDETLLAKFERFLVRTAVAGFRTLDRPSLIAHEPELPSAFQRGIWLQNEGWLDNRALLQALEPVCGEIHYDTPVEPSALEADVVVDCRGTGDLDPELRGVRGEIVRVRAPEVKLTRPIRLMHPRYRLYIAPRTAHEYVIGATQIESDSTAAVTVRSALELLSAAFTVHPGFAEAEVMELSSGLRAAFPDNAPRIRWRDSVLQVNGLYRHGFLIVPALVQRVVKEIEETCKSTLMASA